MVKATEDNDNKKSGGAEKQQNRFGHHTCQICNIEFIKVYDFDRHNRSRHNKHAYNCDVCGKGFLTRTDLRYHRKIHTGTHNFACEYCGRRFDRPARWKLHVEKIHKAKDNLEYCCWLCKVEFTDADELLAHMAIHRTELRYECYLCYKKFESEDGVKDHLELKHGIPRSFDCPECEQTFPDKIRLKWHLIQGCKSAARLFGCRECQTEYTTQSRLDRHNMSKHIGFTKEELRAAMRLARIEKTLDGAIDLLIPEMSGKLVVLWTTKFDDDLKTIRLKWDCEGLIVCTFDADWDEDYLRLLKKCLDYEYTEVEINPPNSCRHNIRIFTFGKHTIPDSWKNRTFSTYRNLEKRFSRHAQEMGRTLFHIVSSKKKNRYTRQCAASFHYSSVFTI